MAKVITFSKRFPVTHPRKGQPTEFILKFWHCPGNWPGTFYLDTWNGPTLDAIRADVEAYSIGDRVPAKSHTIRKGKRFKPGDMFSPRVWSEGAYNSPMVKIGDDTLICKTWDIVLNLWPMGKMSDKGLDVISINGKEVPSDKTAEMVRLLAKNDGLSEEDFRNWFPKHFEGQIICWDETIEYEGY